MKEHKNLADLLDAALDDAEIIAGCWMARSFDLPINDIHTPFTLPDERSKHLALAIDYLRAGELREAIVSFYGQYKWPVAEIPVRLENASHWMVLCHAQYDPQFIAAARNLANELRKAGL